MIDKIFLVMFGIVSISLIIAGCGQQEQEETVKIGGLFGQTGFVAFAGEASTKGFLMAIEDSGMDVDYVIEDFQSDLKLAVTAATKLIEVDGVDVVIGPEWNEFCDVVAPVADEKKVLFISPWMSGEGGCIKADYFFSATPSERSQIRKLLEYMQKQNDNKIVLVYSNNAWSLGSVEIIKDELKSKPEIEIVEEFALNQDSIDYKTEIAKIKEIDPDAIYAIIATDNSHGVFAKQLSELEANYQVYVPFSRGENDVISENFGEFIQGMIYPAPKEYKNMQDFRNKYEAKFGKPPIAIGAATTYDMTTLVLEAIKSGAKTTDEIREYLLNVKDYEGYSNLINFNEDGRLASEDVLIKQINGENPTILEE